MIPSASAGVFKDIKDMKNEMQDLVAELIEMKNTMISLNGTVNYLNKTIDGTMDDARKVVTDIDNMANSVEDMEFYMKGLLGIVTIGIAMLCILLLIVTIAFIYYVKKKTGGLKK